MKKKGLYNSSSCIGFKCKNLNKSALKFYSTKHKFKPSCFNTCVDWTLTVSFLHDKINYSNKIKGNNLFFRSLEKSTLNELTSQGGLKHKNIYESPTFSDLSNLQLKNNENFNELLNIKFPINNKTFNYMIIDANLAIKENLQNIFLIEFDLLNNNKDNNNNKFIKLLREINHPDREIFFVLNGTIHGINIFTSELKFSVEQRKFIKSIKFKLDTYKKDLINQKMQHPNSPDKLKIKNTFFAKVLTNTNIGIEFSKPRFDMRNPEKFQTNFNSIVNSKVLINKIYLEVSIPKSFLCSNNYLTIIDDKIEENEKEIPDIQLDKFNENISNDKTTSTITNSNINNTNTGYNSPIESNFDNLMNNNNNIYSKSSLRNKQINIPSLNQNFNLNFLNIKDHLHNSPHLGYSYPKFLHNQQQSHNIMTPDNLSLLFGKQHSLINNNTLNNINNSTFSSSIHFSPNFGINNFNTYLPLSPGGRSYLGTNNQIMYNNLGCNNNKINYQNIPPFELDPNNSMLSRYSENSLFSESYNNNINSPKSVVNYPSNYYHASFSGINNFGIFNNQSHLSVRSFGRGSFYEGNNFMNNINNNSFNLNINNGSMSPRNVSNFNFTNFTNLNISEDKKIIKGISTIKKKIMDWENSKEKNDLNINNKDKENNIKKESTIHNILMENITKVNYFIDYYENSCNYMIFLRNSGTFLNKKDINLYKDISLNDFFNQFKKVSLFGLKIDYLSINLLSEYNTNSNNNKNVLNVNYSLTLSSFKISFNNKEIILNIIDYLISKNKCTNKLKEKIQENFDKEQITNNINNSYLEFFPIDKNTSIKIILEGYIKLTIEFNENKPPHLRNNFYHQIKDIMNILLINNISINNILGKSYFSIRYTPYNCRSKYNIQTSFVNYYQFKINEERKIFSNKYIDIPLVGILPLKFNHKFFLEKINKEYYNNNSSNNNISDVMIVNSLIQNVTNNFIIQGNNNSIDVEYYLNQQINVN
jgi:hypothetical protein